MLRGKRILIVEDEFYIADSLAMDFADLGAEIVGPAASIDEAFELLGTGETVDWAVLDINVQGAMIYPLAAALRRLGLPFVFATGYDHWMIPADYQSVPICQKPVDPASVARLLAR
ncbi:response regulator [Aureimonas endophytica]|uniref:Response regulator n=2 Tax=Aureimonas endophytica TaxID=2027858 RepID=A0A916ZHV7_9HYPH|nr:response regulator [Aureimonas endophytica]